MIEPQRHEAGVGVVQLAVGGVKVSSSLPTVAHGLRSDHDIAQFVALRAAACVGADYSNLALLNPDLGTMRLYHGTFLDPEIAARFIDVPVDAPFPIAAAVRTGRAVVLDGLDAYRREFPEILDDTVAAGIEATVSMPLVRSGGSPIGAIGFAWARAPQFDVQLDRALEALAHLCSEVVERAELYEAEHQLIADLHNRLLGEFPAHPGIATAARYLPAGASQSVGGDWYEGLTLDDGTLGVVVGDVTGHGLAAAADMALVRGTISALLHDGVSPDLVLGRVSRILQRRPGFLVATAALVVIDTANHTLTYATAGHPPPLLIDPDGQVHLLDEANAPLLGVNVSRDVAQQVPFLPGSRLLMFTDGLVERRDRPIDEGIAQARVVLSEARHASPVELVENLIGALVGDDVRDDDIAVVVVEHVA